MANEIITTLHPDQDPDTNLYPNIKKQNIPDKSISVDKLDQNVLDLIGSLKPSGTDLSTNILAFTTNKGIYIGTDTKDWYYWDGTHYVDGGSYIADNPDYNFDENSNNSLVNRAITNEFKSNNKYIDDIINSNIIRYGFIAVVGNNQYVSKTLPNIEIKQYDTLNITIDSVEDYNSTSYIALVRFYDENDTLLEQTSIPYNNYNNFSYISHYNSSYCTILLTPAPNGPLSNGKAYYTNINIWINSKKFNLSDNVNYQFKDNILKFMPHIVNNLPEPEYDNYSLLVNNHLFVCDKVKCTSGTIINQGIEMEFKPPYKNVWLCAKGSRDLVVNDFVVRITLYDENNVVIGSVNTKINNEKISIYIKNNTDRIVVTFAVTWGATIPQGTDVNLTDLDVWFYDGLDYIIGNGDFNYFGSEKISLKNNTYYLTKNNNITKNFNEWHTLTGETLGQSNHNSIAIYNNYIFVFIPNDKLFIYNIDNFNENYIVSMPFSAHANSAIFTDEFYDDNDTYPILLLSNCEVGGLNTINVLRITNQNDTFNVTLLKTITINDNRFIYGASFTYNPTTKEIIGVCNPNGNYLVSDNNPLMFSKFNKPNLIDGNDVVINSNDINIIKEYPHAVLQQLYYYNGYYYLGLEIYSNNLYWRNKSGFYGSAVIRLDDNFNVVNYIRNTRVETEGVYVYNDKLYVSSKLSYGSNYNVDCFWVDEYNFD